MADSTPSCRGSKRELTDESKNGQPIVKSAKKEETEPAPSPEVAELLEKLKSASSLERQREQERATMAEKKFEDLDELATKLARELLKEREERRAERKKTNEIVGDLTKKLEEEKGRAASEKKKKAEETDALATKLARELLKEREERREEQKKTNEIVSDLTKRLDEEKGRAAHDRKRSLIERMKDNERVTFLSNQLEVKRKRASERENSLTTQLEKERRRATERENNLSKDVEEERKRANEDRKRGLMERMRDRKRIEELTLKLSQYEGGPQMQQAALSSDQQPLQTQNPQRMRHTSKIHDDGHPTNILQLCRSNTTSAISLDDALSNLRLGYDDCCSRDVKLCPPYLHMNLECEICEETLNGFSILAHFFSQGHIEKVRASRAGVSKAAAHYWLFVLQRATLSYDEEDNEDEEEDEDEEEEMSEPEIDGSVSGSGESTDEEEMEDGDCPSNGDC